MSDEAPIFRQSIIPHFLVWSIRVVLLGICGLLFLVMAKNPSGISILSSIVFLLAFFTPTNDFYIYEYKMVRTTRIGFDFISWDKSTLFGDMLNVIIERHVLKIPKKTAFGTHNVEQTVEIALIELRNGKKFKLSESILLDAQLELKRALESYQKLPSKANF